jgi:hypothetical protein
MSYDNDQNEYPAPLDPLSRKVSNLLPRFYRTDSNKKFIHATLDQLIQPGTVKKVNGYIGRQDSKATTSNDIFVKAPTTDRQTYQLEPSVVIKDDNPIQSVLFKYDLTSNDDDPIKFNNISKTNNSSKKVFILYTYIVLFSLCNFIIIYFT